MIFNPTARIQKYLTDLVFPKVCQNCGGSFTDGLSNILCRSCFDSIQPYEDPVCSHCGVSLPIRGFEEAMKIRCRDCGEGDYYLDSVRSLGPYEGPIRIAHHAFKFEGMENFKTTIADKIVQHVPPFFWESVEALVPIPLSPEKERERGYNPSFLLAGEISRQTRIPVRLFLKKVRSTKPQMSLDKTERLKNPKNAYAVLETAIIPQKIVLVDDVFTTGSTLEECARVLKKAADAWIGAVVFGRTPHR